MSEYSSFPPLKPLHPEALLNPGKIESLETEVIKQALIPGHRDCLKTRPDGTILDGHHRIYVLRKRGTAVDALPREIVVKGND